MSKLLQFKPIEKREYHGSCRCYDGFRDKKPLKLIVDPYERFVYCDHCGNAIDPYKALELLCDNWEELEKLQQATRRRIRRAWEIGQRYRPHKRVIRDLEKQIGRHAENEPCCPRCGEPFRLEEITSFVCNSAGHRHTASGYHLGKFNDTEADRKKENEAD